MEIVEVTEVTPTLVAAFERLVPQLTRSRPTPSLDALQSIVDSPACHLLIAVEESEVVGTLTLVVFPIPTATRAWVEDVVVDEAYASRGIGRRLTREAINMARNLGANSVDLTSRPTREAANHLYRKIGFRIRETNLYRFEL